LRPCRGGKQNGGEEDGEFHVKPRMTVGPGLAG
jgi:hypothetical protein